MVSLYYLQALTATILIGTAHAFPNAARSSLHRRQCDETMEGVGEALACLRRRDVSCLNALDVTDAALVKHLLDPMSKAKKLKDNPELRWLDCGVPRAAILAG